MRQVMLFAIVMLVLAGVAPRYLANVGQPATTMATATEAGSSANASSGNSRTITIRQSNNGHFQVEAMVDGRRMDFLVDTGATSIALRESDAARLGIHPAVSDYTMRSSTANGIIRVAPVSLDRVEVGDITVRNVDAVIIPDQALSQNLLGMSFLSRVRWQQENGQLVLDQ
jgi:aspartyl protease family protein